MYRYDPDEVDAASFTPARKPSAWRRCREGRDVTEAAGAWSAVAGLPATGALRVRPDGYILASADDADRGSALTAAFSDIAA